MKSGGEMFLVSGGFGGRKLGGGKKSPGASALVGLVRGLKSTDGYAEYKLATVAISRFVGNPDCMDDERKYIMSLIAEE